VLHIRLREGSANTSRGFARFLDELLARLERAGASGPKLLRADSGFWNNHAFDKLDQAGWHFSIGVRLQPAVRAAIEAIDEAAWHTLADYPDTSIPQIAETTLNGRRLVVRRVRTLDRQGQLLPSWELFPFVTNRTDDLAVVEAEHRQHAVIELAIRDLKDQALAHFPSRHFYANAAWTVIAALAHNPLRWTSLSGCPTTPSASPAPSAAGCWRCPAASPAQRAAGRCTSPPAGPGTTTSSAPSRASEPCPRRPEPPRIDHNNSQTVPAHRRGLTPPKIAGRGALTRRDHARTKTHAPAISRSRTHPRQYCSGRAINAHQRWIQAKSAPDPLVSCQ